MPLPPHCRSTISRERWLPTTIWRRSAVAERVIENAKEKCYYLLKRPPMSEEALLGAPLPPEPRLLLPLIRQRAARYINTSLRRVGHVVMLKYVRFAAVNGTSLRVTASRVAAEDNRARALITGANPPGR